VLRCGPIGADAELVRRSSVSVLVGISLVVAGCGGSGATPRSAAGVRADYSAFVHLLANGEAKRACASYVSAAFKAAIAGEKRGSCRSFLASAWTREHATVSRAMSAIETIRVHGDHAAITTRTGTRAMVYVAGHWQESPLYKIIVTEPGGASFSITRNSDGSTVRTCHPAGEAGCSSAGTW
jgi:hypothetical protein